MPRLLQPELLDSLPADHPDALHSRRDLRLINFFMGNHRWFARTLPPLLRAGERTLELGAGHGELGQRLLARGVALDGLDVAPRPPTWPAARRWHAADIRTFAGYEEYPAVIANLILHQLSESELAALGARLRAKARLIVACEPLRSPQNQRLFAVVGPLFGVNYVTRHDARVSIAAGFRGDELPLTLGLDPAVWTWRCTTTAFGAYHLVATRRA